MRSGARNSTRCCNWRKKASANCWTSSARRSARKASPMRLVVASSNQGKLAEIREVLAGLHVELVAQGDIGIGDADEVASTFIENALLKARHASRLSGLPALGDDSGICVDALGGAPGLYSARYAGAQG